MPGDTAEGSSRCDLVLSYVTSEADWTPCYDLSLSTTDAAATLCFDAHVRNATSETWSGCKVILSTSRASSGGLDDSTPTLVPWNITLASISSKVPICDITCSREERIFSNQATQVSRASVQVPRSSMSGLVKPGSGVSFCTSQSHQQEAVGGLFGNTRNDSPSQASSLFGNQKRDDGAPRGSLFGAVNPDQDAGAATQFGSAAGSGSSNQGLFGTSGSGFGGKPKLPLGGTAFRSSAPSGAFGAAATCDGNNPTALDELAQCFGASSGFGAAPVQVADADATLQANFQQSLDFEDSIMEDTGFTSSYELPGLKTLAPKSSSSKQRVMRFKFQEVVFSHTVTAKYRPVAMLKAKLNNTSKVAFPKGPVGIVLDGACLDRTTLPQHSASDLIALNLGVDPAIQVQYPKPLVRRDTGSLFGKENNAVSVAREKFPFSARDSKTKDE